MEARTQRRRRGSRSFVGIAGALLLAGAGGLRGADWPGFLGPNGDGTSPETGLVDQLPAKPLWQREIGSGYGAPSIRGDLCVFHHRRGAEEVVEACDAATGETRWKHAYPSQFVDPFGYNNGPRCSPLLTADKCYTLGAEGTLLCLNLKDGAEVWRRDTGKDFHVPEAFFGVGANLLLEGERLIAQVGGQPNSGVVAFDPLTGKTLWESVGGKNWSGVPMSGWAGERTINWDPQNILYEKQASYAAPVAATIHGKRRILCCTRQGLVCLDPQNGAVDFSFWFRARQDSSVNGMPPVARDDQILLSSAYYKTGAVLLRAGLDGKAVSEVWRGVQLEMHWSRPLLIGGELYAFSGRNEPDAHFRCVEFATGKVRWDRDEGWPNGGHSKLGAGESPPNVFGRASAIYADGKIIAMGEAGLLGLFRPNPEKVEELSRWQAPGLNYPCWAAPALANGRLYLRSEDHLLCLDLTNKRAGAR